MIAQIRAIFDITDEEALYIREVTEEKSKDPAIGIVVQGNRENTLSA
jgi:type I restriction enzyme R subunit